MKEEKEDKKEELAKKRERGKESAVFGILPEHLTRGELLKEFEFEEEIFEDVKGEFIPTGFPKPGKHYKLVWEIYNLPIEEPYFWMLQGIRDWGFDKIIKTEDIFTASEHSSFFGASAAKLGAQQDKVVGYLISINKLVKEMFQLVREIRVMDERLDHYISSEKGGKGAEITLKGMFIDLVQGGAKNPASVYGMARELNFIVLPDLFFDAPPMKEEDVEGHIKRLEKDFNKKMLEVLRRHLVQFITWKRRTYQEITHRRKFLISYLKQHVDVIKMYMNWVKPYLKHVARLQDNTIKLDSPDLVGAFETSMIDIELLATKKYTGSKDDKYAAFPVVLVDFYYRTKPSMQFAQEGYHRGPIHVGKLEMHIRSYGWSGEEIKKYLEMKSKEDINLLKNLSQSVAGAMDALGDDLYGYIAEAEEYSSIKKDKEGGRKKEEGGKKGSFREYMEQRAKKKKDKEEEKKRAELKDKKESAKNAANNAAFQNFKNFKKAHRMIMW